MCYRLQLRAKTHLAKSADTRRPTTLIWLPKKEPQAQVVLVDILCKCLVEYNQRDKASHDLISLRPAKLIAGKNTWTATD